MFTQMEGISGQYSHISGLFTFAVEPPVSGPPKMSSLGGRLRELTLYWVKILLQ